MIKLILGCAVLILAGAILAFALALVITHEKELNNPKH